MALTSRPNLIKRLQTGMPRGAPFDHRALAQLGVSSALAHHYVRTGWLARLERGVFMFPNDELKQDDCLRFLSRRLPGFHVGGKTALAWRGIRHNLPSQEPLWLWGEKKARLPNWFLRRWRARYTTRSPFTPTLPRKLGLESLPEAPNGVLVSVPERAVIEMLSEVGIHQGIEEARNILEGVRSLRSNILAELLRRCRRVKAKRLCVVWAEELNLPWATAARRAVARRLGRSRWVARLKDGTTLALRP